MVAIIFKNKKVDSPKKTQIHTRAECKETQSARRWIRKSDTKWTVELFRRKKEEALEESK